MKIEMGKKYRTVNGQSVRILCVDSPNESFPVVGLIGESGHIATFTSNGLFRGDFAPGDEDIVEVSQWDDFKIDDLVLVWDNIDADYRVRRHFAGVNSSGRPTAFIDGKTSFSSFDVGGNYSDWDNCIKFEEKK